MKKQQKIEAIDIIRNAKLMIRSLADGHQEMTLEYYHRLLNQLDELQVLFMRETKE